MYFRKQKGWEVVRDLLFDAFQSDQKLLLTSINWGEVYYTLLKTGGEEKIEKLFQAAKDEPMPHTLIVALTELERQGYEIFVRFFYKYFL